MAVSKRLICAATDLVDGGHGVRFEINTNGEREPAFVVRYGGRAYGYLNRCGHVPVELDWQPGVFYDHSGLYLICSTHGALYAPESGRCLAGRCGGRGLQPIAIDEHDGQIFFLESE